MLSLSDFYHLPQLDPLIHQMVSEPAGLLLIAGLDSRPIQGKAAGFLPSGRQSLLGILVDEILSTHATKRCIVVTAEKDLLRVPRQFKRRVQVELIKAHQDYPERIAAAVQDQPGLLVIDELSQESVLPAFEAARQGLRVLSQYDTIFCGSEVTRQLLHLGTTEDDLHNLRWVLAIQRMPTLCPKCKQPATLEPAHLEMLHTHPALAGSRVDDLTFYQASGCTHCHNSGRLGDVAVFDVFRNDGMSQARLPISSLLPRETYIWELVRSGHLPVEDFLDFETLQFQRAFNLFIDRERTLMETRTALESQLLQLEAANKVLQQRTEALVSFQAIGQAMISSDNLEDLAARLCRHACQLCAAERAILYYQRFEGQVEVLAVAGWEATLVRRQVDMDLILTAQVGPQPQAFDWPPPGVPVLLDNFSLQAGLAISLYAQNEWVGLMILHTSQKDHFLPGEVALLETFASQAALAIQRAGLVEQLGDKITRLEAAQVELAHKERLEREMELARQVQHSLLPRTFPDLPGFRFAARFEPARQVGGDFFDVIALEDGRFGVAIADVTDKGMPAALYMAITRSLLRAEAHRERSPGNVLANVNRLLMELGEPNMFVTLFFGIIDPATRFFNYARAGHERPYLLRDGGLKPFDGEGMALGLLAGKEFQVTEQQITLSPGDKLVLYTDGLSDVLNSEDELFDRSRLEPLLRSNSNQAPEALCDAVFAALDRYRGDTEQYDDMTLLVVEVV